MSSSFELETYSPPDKHKRQNVPLVAFENIQRKYSESLADKFIAEIVDLVSQSNLSQWVHNLSAFHTRHTKSTYINQVTTWLVNQFKSFGYTNVELHQYNREGYQLDNVVCTKQGAEHNGQILILCAHCDCIMENPHDVEARAPGADDNATGVSVMLELARILARVDTKDTIQFIAFSGEEQGFWGSTAYAQYVQDNNINLHRLINLDQVGYPPDDFSIIVERDLGNQVSTNDQPSQHFGNLMARMAADYTNMPTKLGPIYGSDYMPFEARGYVVIGAYEAERNPNYHSRNDTSDTVDYSYVADVARMTLATILYETGALMSLLSVRDIAARCLNKFPPISIRRDIYGGGDPQIRSLREQLKLIRDNC